MGKIIKKRIEYGGSSNSAENIKYDDTKNVKEAINEVDNLLGNTDISAIGDGTVTGGLNALNSNLDSKLEIKVVLDKTQSDVIKVIENNWTSKPLDSGIWKVDTSSFTYTAYITNYGANYGEAFLTSYSLSNPIYGVLSGGAWTWSEISTNNNLLIKGYIDKNIGNVQLDSRGYLDIRVHVPTNITVVLAGIKTFGASAKASGFNITSDGSYIIGAGGDLISDVVIRYYYS